MKNSALRQSLVFAAAAWLPLAAQPSSPAPTPAAAAPHGDASAPMLKANNARFLELHEAFLARGKAGPIGVLFLGDSITERWKTAPEIWRAHYEKYQPANFGIGGDSTQHVLWRIEHGELDGLHPRVVVLMLGTNNSLKFTGAEIAAADAKIVRLIQEKIPGVKVLLLAIFPRGPHKNGNGTADDGVQRMQAIRAANALLAQLDNGKSVRFLDLNAHFIGPDGKLPSALFPEQLHPSVAGYQVWADAMQPLLDEMMQP